MTVRIGDRLPDGTLQRLEHGRPRWIPTASVFGSRRVVLFSCPGAFTTKSTERQVPSYLRCAEEFHRLGLDAIVCISVNDPWVMDAWAQACGISERIQMLADFDCQYHRALGLELDCLRMTLGLRSQRFSMLIEEGVVAQLNVEELGRYEVSDGSVLLHQMRSAVGSRQVHDR